MDSYKKYFRKIIKYKYPGSSDKIIATVETNFKIISPDTAFASSSSNPLDKRLDFCGYFLSLIKTLDEQGETYETIRENCLAIVIEYVRPKNKMQQLMKRVPAKLLNTRLGKIFIKAFGKKLARRSHEDGFVAKIITDKNETFGFGYGFDILECGICKLFKKHRYEKYASILCEVDEITSGLAGLKLIRTSTIALGAHKCDFRFQKESTS